MKSFLAGFGLFMAALIAEALVRSFMNAMTVFVSWVSDALRGHDRQSSGGQ